MSAHDDRMERLQQADPVDAAELLASWSESDAKASLLKEITAMPATTATINPVTPLRTPVGPSRRERPLVLAAAAVIAVLALVAGFTLAGTADPAYAISTTADGLIQINVLADFRDGEALARDLRDRGVDTEVQTIPASPSLVGTVELGTTDGPATGIQTGGADGSNEVFDWTIDPSVFTGTLRVTVFVKADDGELFGAAQEVFEPGEKLAGLHCALGEPMRAADVAQFLGQVGLTPEWSVVTPTDDPSITNSARVDQVPDGIVLSGYATDNTHVRFDVLEDGQSLDSESGGYISDFPCTPEAAAQWN